jgi:hypothetical protein
VRTYPFQSPRRTTSTPDNSGSYDGSSFGSSSLSPIDQSASTSFQPGSSLQRKALDIDPNRPSSRVSSKNNGAMSRRSSTVDAEELANQMGGLSIQKIDKTQEFMKIKCGIWLPLQPNSTSDQRKDLLHKILTNPSSTFSVIYYCSEDMPQGADLDACMQAAVSKTTEKLHIYSSPRSIARDSSALARAKPNSNRLRIVLHDDYVGKYALSRSQMEAIVELRNSPIANSVRLDKFRSNSIEDNALIAAFPDQSEYEVLPEESDTTDVNRLAW